MNVDNFKGALPFLSAFVFVFVSLLVGFCIGFLFSKFRTRSELQKARRDAVGRSRAVLVGQFTEQISPYLPNFPYNPKDMRFIGAPVDYIVFDGLSSQNLKQVVFLEIKTGKSSLNINEKSLRSVIEEKKVFYREYRVPI